MPLVTTNLVCSRVSYFSAKHLSSVDDVDVMRRAHRSGVEATSMSHRYTLYDSHSETQG